MKKTVLTIAAALLATAAACAAAPELRNMMPNSWEKLTRLTAEEEKEFLSQQQVKSDIEGIKSGSWGAPNIRRHDKMPVFFAGILYPKILYNIKQKNQPPLSIKERFAKGLEYGQELLFTFRRSGNGFKYRIYLDVFTREAYSGILIKKMWITYGGKEYQILEDISLAIPGSVVPVEAIDNHSNKDEWLSDGEFYFTQGIYMRPRHGSKPFPGVDFGKIFKGKKAGETFTFKMSCTYSFDDEPQKTEERLFNVRCHKGEYVSPFMGW